MIRDLPPLREAGGWLWVTRGGGAPCERLADNARGTHKKTPGKGQCRYFRARGSCPVARPLALPALVAGGSPTGEWPMRWVEGGGGREQSCHRCCWWQQGEWWWGVRSSLWGVPSHRHGGLLAHIVRVCAHPLSRRLSRAGGPKGRFPKVLGAEVRRHARGWAEGVQCPRPRPHTARTHERWVPPPIVHAGLGRAALSPPRLDTRALGRSNAAALMARVAGATASADTVPHALAPVT